MIVVEEVDTKKSGGRCLSMETHMYLCKIRVFCPVFKIVSAFLNLIYIKPKIPQLDLSVVSHF